MLTAQASMHANTLDNIYVLLTFSSLYRNARIAIPLHLQECAQRPSLRRLYKTTVFVSTLLVVCHY